jgi:hypothetical protein
MKYDDDESFVKFIPLTQRHRMMSIDEILYMRKSL